MNLMLLSGLYGTFAGVVGTALGGLLGLLLFFFGKRYNKLNKVIIKKNIAFALLYELSSGLMMAVVTFHMLPEAIKEGGMLYSLIGLFLGIIFVFILQKLIYKYSKSNVSFKTGIILLCGIALHNFPEGIAIGATFSNDIKLAISILFIIAIHDIPEGISVFVPLYASGMKFYKIILLIALSGLPTGIGAVVGSLIGVMGLSYNSMSLGFASGSMLYICVSELSFEAKELYNRKIISVAYILGLIIGMILK
jgi:ZIP family zinc transporter